MVLCASLLLFRNRFCRRWISLVVDIGGLMNGVAHNIVHMMKLIWGLLGV